MENASKALEMAGGVLIALMVLGLLVLGYNRISDLKQIEQDADTVAKEYFISFEEYNKNGLYGSELFSLVNKIKDYNTKYPESEGYTQVSLDVTINKDHKIGNLGISKGTYGENELYERYTSLATAIYNAGHEEITAKRQGETKNTTGTIAGYWTNVSDKELREILSTSNYEKITKYRDLVNLQTEIVRLTFDVKQFEYDNMGRITNMTFVEN